MKTLFSRPVTLIVLFAIIIPVSSLSASNQRLALVIGNGAYRSAPLRNPVNDATDMATALKRLDFAVTLKTDANQRTMDNAIRNFGKQLRQGGVGLFYYAGHGVQVKGQNYLIPIGSRIETESDVKYEAVDAGRVLGKMEDAGNGLNIIILDACRDNPFGRSFRSSGRGLNKMDAPEGSILAYATAPGKTAFDGEEKRNGLYTAKLLKHIMTPGVPIELFFKRVRRDVHKDSGKKQIPWTESSLIGDFYFNSKGGHRVSAERERLEQERRELERLKSEFEARQKLEADRKRVEANKKKLHSEQTPQYASLDPATVSAKIVARDGNYEKLKSGLVRDTRTGLEWYVGSDKRTTWNQAKSWVESLNIDGSGWRMPTREELKSLYQKGAGKRNMTPLLKTTGWGIWSGETMGSSAACFFYFFPGYEFWSGRTTSSLDRGFAVRSRR